MITTTEDGARWAGWCAEVGVADVYWSWEHLSLWAPEWDAKPLGIRWTGKRDTILHPVLMVPLDRLTGGEGRFDLRTAYDFAGPLHVGPDPARAMGLFEEEWTRQAKDLGAVTEFLRLHPRALPTRPSWAIHHADHPMVDLIPSYEGIRNAYRGSWRWSLRKAEAEPTTVEISASPDPGLIDSFLTMYRDTMNRRGASFEFRFRDATLRGFLALPESWLGTVRDPDGAPIAHATILASGSTLFYHLSCSDPEGLSFRPNHKLLDAVVRLGKDRGFTAFHLGGGSTTLQSFKKHMGNTSVPYFVVRRVVDAEAYSAICRANGADPSGPSFPAYMERFGG
ncbi:GNAT family N-acetyltransferase [Gemmatimonadota bacterium]